MASPDDMTRAQFDDLLAQYPAVVAAASAAQGAQPGRKSLLELDRYRYVVAPDCFAVDGPRRRDMTLDDVKALVEWKLRHGKFRPTLMALVASNPPALVQSAIRAALHAYRDDTLPAALAALCRLRGVGPATASLLLAVHHPDRVVFFSDHVFCWLCRRPDDKAPIRYTAAEYHALARRAAQLTARLGVSPADVERVAYVLIRRRPEPARAQPHARKAARKRSAEPETSPSRDTAGLRRSKRLKK